MKGSIKSGKGKQRAVGRAMIEDVIVLPRLDYWIGRSFTAERKGEKSP